MGSDLFFKLSKLLKIDLWSLFVEKTFECHKKIVDVQCVFHSFRILTLFLSCIILFAPLQPRAPLCCDVANVDFSIWKGGFLKCRNMHFCRLWNMERYKSIILGEDVIFAETNNTSVDICWYLAYLDICAPWLEEGGGLVDYTADEQTDICPNIGRFITIIS